MLELLTTKQFSTSITDCQAYYLENELINEPTRSPEERREWPRRSR